NDLIFGANTVSHTTVAGGGGFPGRFFSLFKELAADQGGFPSRGYNARASMNVPCPPGMQRVGFKAASGGSGDLSPPTAPSNLLATAAGTGGIDLTWTASVDNVGVTDYLIERCQGSGCQTFTQVNTTASTTFSDTGLLSQTSYSYRTR